MQRRRFFGKAQAQQSKQSAARGRAHQDVSVVAFADRRAERVQFDHDERPLLTVEETRVRLGLGSIAAVYRRIHQPDGIPIRRLGPKTIRIHQGELDQWTRRQRQDERQPIVIFRGA